MFVVTSDYAAQFTVTIAGSGPDTHPEICSIRERGSSVASPPRRIHVPEKRKVLLKSPLCLGSGRRVSAQETRPFS